MLDRTLVLIALLMAFAHSANGQMVDLKIIGFIELARRRLGL